MKWLRWLGAAAGPATSGRTDAAPGDTGITPDGRDVGACEVCGHSLYVRTRRDAYRGRVDCDCGHRNHVEFHPVRTAAGVSPRHVTMTAGRKFEAATHEPDLRLSWRYGLCQSCHTAVSLLDAFVISSANAHGDEERFAYYCRSCHVHDDPKRGRLIGHDKSHVVDFLRFSVR